MDEDTIDRLLAARAATERYEQDYEEKGDVAKEEFHRVLKELGFNSSEEFFKWNTEMVVQAVNECRPNHGECDGCPGIKNPPCKAFFADKSCAVTGKVYDYRALMRAMYILERAKGKKPSTNTELIQRHPIINRADGDRIYYFCPPKHGFYWLVHELKEFPFDMQWLRGIHLR